MYIELNLQVDLFVLRKFLAHDQITIAGMESFCTEFYVRPGMYKL